MRQKKFWLFFLSAIVLFSVVDRYLHPSWECEQLFLQQAKSFSQGRLNIDVFDLDTATFNNQYFVPYPPTPALVFTPAVALFGAHPLIPYVVCFLALGLICLLLFRISKHLGLDTEISSWLCLAAICGTGLWMCLQYSYSAAYNSHIFSTLFIFAGLHEAVVKKRPWLVGLWLSAACTTRPFTVMAGPLLLTLLWVAERKSVQTKIKDILYMALGAAPLVAFAMLFNYKRFGDVFNVGYSHIPSFNMAMDAMFNLKFIPRNLYMMFLRGPDMDILFDGKSVSSAVHFEYGILGSDMGTALTYASPFLLFAFYAPLKNLVVKMGWVSTLLNLFPVLCYAAIGRFQLNFPRYAIDFLPIILLLTIIGLRSSVFQHRTFKLLVVYSVLLNVIFLTPFLGSAIEYYIKMLLFFRS